jgi:integrase
MPPRRPRLPSYRRHASGQAFVQVKGVRHYLGKWGTPESQERYRRAIAELVVAPERTRPSPSTPGRCPGDGITIVELIVAYLRHADAYYCKPDGTPTGQASTIRLAMRPVRQLYGESPAAEFGPLALRAVQQALVESGLARGPINQRTQIVKAMFRWAVSLEMLPANVYQALATVPGLKAGRSAARETAPVASVDDATVAATLPHLPQVVRDIVQIQRLTGCRPGEVCAMRPCDVDRSGEVWTYKPATHKTEHHGKQRTICIGPKAQEILLPYLLRDSRAYCFSPAESEAQRRADLRERRKTPVQPSQADRRKRSPKRKPADRYVRNSYNRAIRRAVDRANHAALAAHDEVDRAAGAPPMIPVWHPNQLRHAAATEIRRKFGLEGAQVALGHSKADVTQVYTERDMTLAIEVARKIG